MRCSSNGSKSPALYDEVSISPEDGSGTDLFRGRKPQSGPRVSVQLPAATPLLVPNYSTSSSAQMSWIADGANAKEGPDVGG